MTEMYRIMKLAPAPVIKPWGMKHAEVASATGIGVGLGELWLASAQMGQGNYASEISQPEMDQNLNEVLAQAAKNGDSALKSMLGERPLRMLRDNPHRGKTEAWLVRDAVGRPGFAAGPRTIEQCHELKARITGPGLSPDIDEWSEEVRDLFGIIQPVRPGEVYMVPAGTLHTMFAMDEDSRLIVDEIQQGYGTSWLPTLSKILMVQNSLLSVQVHPSDMIVQKVAQGEKEIDQNLEDNPTVRVYDFGRRPGEYPELGFELTDPDAGLRRVSPVEMDRADGVCWSVLVACDYFMKSQFKLEPGFETDLAPIMNSYHILHCTSGGGAVDVNDSSMMFTRGDTMFIPACLEDEVTLKTECGCSVYDDVVPGIDTLNDYLMSGGVRRNNVEALFDPPRAFET